VSAHLAESIGDHPDRGRDRPGWLVLVGAFMQKQIF
jgi:hypothetical protein